MIRRTLFLLVVIFLLGGCGYSEEEWQAQLDKYARLTTEHKSTQDRLAELESELTAARERVKTLEQNLLGAGVDITKLSKDLESRNTELSKAQTSLEEREKALAEYKLRARQLERIRQRFDRLRRKLNALTKLGLAVKIHKNRMLISLPGDVLFSSGRDSLTPDGEAILDKVAGIINADASLRSRQYQVAGHTDSKPYRGTFRDNWGLSLMRARGVLLYLVGPEKGALPPNRWSAAGFGDTDPIADNETPEGRQQNRRCELIVVPSAEEMLDLQKIAK